MARRRTPELAAAADDLLASKDDPELLTGEEVHLEPAPGPVSVVVSVRLNGEDLRRIEQAAERSGRKLSTFLREAALAASAEGPSVLADADLLVQLTGVLERLDQLNVAGRRIHDHLVG